MFAAIVNIAIMPAVNPAAMARVNEQAVGG
jgi:hypothetical protein